MRVSSRSKTIVSFSIKILREFSWLTFWFLHEKGIRLWSIHHCELSLHAFFCFFEVVLLLLIEKVSRIEKKGRSVHLNFLSFLVILSHIGRILSRIMIYLTPNNKVVCHTINFVFLSDRIDYDTVSFIISYLSFLCCFCYLKKLNWSSFIGFHLFRWEIFYFLSWGQV
jgi:hypothetical protein